MTEGFFFCKGRTFCHRCRLDRRWRKTFFDLKRIESVDFECPHGVTMEDAVKIQSEALAKIPAQDLEKIAEIRRKLDEAGRNAWLWLHMEAKAKKLTEVRLKKEFWPMIPYGCVCKKEAAALIEGIPFRQDDQFQWSVDFHNAINKKIGKPEWVQFPVQ